MTTANIAVIGLLATFVAIILALIFKEGFRKDLTAGTGQAEFFGILSVQGVVVVLLSALVLGAIVYILTKVESNLTTDVETIQSKLDGANTEIEELRLLIGELRASLSEAESKASTCAAQETELRSLLADIDEGIADVKSARNEARAAADNTGDLNGCNSAGSRANSHAQSALETLNSVRGQLSWLEEE